MRQWRRFWWVCVVMVCLWMYVAPPAAIAEGAPSESSVAALFTQECAGCHVNGGNIVRRGKTLKQRALERNHVDSVEAIAHLITNGRGIMSAYGDRLTSEEIDLLAHYVWNQAQTDWR